MRTISIVILLMLPGIAMAQTQVGQCVLYPDNTMHCPSGQPPVVCMPGPGGVVMCR